MTEYDDRTATPTEPPGITPSRFGALFALGFVGVLALALTTVSQLDGTAGLPDVPISVLLAAVVVQSSVLLSIAVLVGLYAAPRVGFRSHVLDRVTDGRPILARLRSELRPAIALGLAAGVAIVLAEVVLAPTPAVAEGTAEVTVGSLLASVPLRFLYGGITEELLLRWGVMSLAALVGRRTIDRGRGRLSPTSAWAAIVVAAVLFGIGHLPTATAIYGGLTPEVVTWIVVGNAIGGIAFGWLFWRCSLEAAMIGHAAAHVVLVGGSLVVLLL